MSHSQQDARPGLFVAITEFGTTRTEASKVYRDLFLRENRVNSSFPFKSQIIATFGSTDLVELSFFDNYFHFAEISSSSAHAFRRTSGAKCVDFGLDSIPPRADCHHTITSASELIDSNRENPFMSVLYLKISPIPILCHQTTNLSDHEPLVHRIISRTISRGAEIWKTVRGVLASSLELNHELPPSSLSFRLTPLVGLDSIDVVFLIRTSCLEENSSIAWAFRNCKLGSALPSHEFQGSIKRLARLFGMSTREVREFWDESPLFSGTTSVIGIPLIRPAMKLLEPHTPNAMPSEPSAKIAPATDTKWRLEESDGHTKTFAARRAILLQHTNFAAGCFGEALKATRKRDVTYESSDYHHDNQDIPVAPKEEESASSAYEFLMLFDRADSLKFPLFSKAYDTRPREWSVHQIRDHLMSIFDLEDQENLQEGLSSSTEIAIKFRVPDDVVGRAANSKAIIRLKELLGRMRKIHLLRDTEEFQSTTSLSNRWLKVARESGIVYSATNGIVNIICAALDHLDDDLEDFLDLLIILNSLVSAVEDSFNQGLKLSSQQTVWLITIVERLAAARGRRDDPLRLSSSTLVFGGHAGYRTSRDAFIAFSEVMAYEIDSEALVIILDDPAGGVSCEVGPCHWDVLSVSALALNDPIHWLVSHELAHGRLEHMTLEDIMPGRSSQYLLEILSASGETKVALHDTVDDLIQRIGESLSHFGEEHLEESPFAEAMRQCLLEVFADLAFWQSLSLSDSRVEETRELFWFVHGPGLVLAVQHKLGFTEPDKRTLQALVLRCVILDLIFSRMQTSGRDSKLYRHSPSSIKKLMDEIHDTLALVLSASATSNPSGRDSRYDDAKAHLLFLRRSLDISPKKWVRSIQQLQRSLKVSALSDQTRNIFQNWISFCLALHEDIHTANNLTELKQRQLQQVKQIYRDYLTELRALWGAHAKPWPSFIKGHEDPQAVEREEEEENMERLTLRSRPYLSRRGGVFVFDTKLQGESGPADRIDSSTTEESGQRQYHRVTNRFISQLCELAREQRFYKLKAYLEGFPDS